MTVVEEQIFGGNCSGGCMHKQGCEKNRTYHFVRKSAYFALKIELLLTMMSKFERVENLKAQLFDG